MKEESQQSDANVSSRIHAENDGVSIVSLVLGISGFILSFIPFISFLAWIVGFFAIILGAVSLNQTQKKGMPAVGLVLGIVTIGWKLVMAIVTISTLAGY